MQAAALSERVCGCSFSSHDFCYCLSHRPTRAPESLNSDDCLCEFVSGDRGSVKLHSHNKTAGYRLGFNHAKRVHLQNLFSASFDLSGNDLFDEFHDGTSVARPGLALPVSARYKYTGRPLNFQGSTRSSHPSTRKYSVNQSLNTESCGKAPVLAKLVRLKINQSGSALQVLHQVASFVVPPAPLNLPRSLHCALQGASSPVTQPAARPFLSAHLFHEIVPVVSAVLALNLHSGGDIPPEEAHRVYTLHPPGGEETTFRDHKFIKSSFFVLCSPKAAHKRKRVECSLSLEPDPLQN
jgi:hypothetical protein